MPCAALAAEKLAPLDAEFLEYLEDLEGDEEDWTLFEEKKPPPPPPPKPKATDKPAKEAAPSAADKK
jgi:hypothetical protein